MGRLHVVAAIGSALGIALPLALACGGTTTSDGGKSGSITGTWEVMGTQYSRHPASLVVTVSPTTLTFTGGRSSLTAVAHGDTFNVTYSSYYVRKFDATRTGSPGNAGIVPLPLFGTWSLKNDRGNGCDGDIGSDTMTGECTDNLSAWPEWLPSIGYGQFTAKRTRQLTSDFGDFGGEWSITTSRNASCTARFEHSTMSSVCTSARKANGTASLTFDGGNAHGTTSAGVEFSAQRR